MGLPTIYYAGITKAITLSQRPQRQQFIDPDQRVLSNTSISGLEERLNVRLDLPVSFSYRYFVSSTEATLKRNLQQWLALAKEGAQWFFALDSAEAVLTTLSVSASVGDSTITVADASPSILGSVVGKQFMIRSSTRGELVKVASAVGNVLTLTETLNNDWFAGDRFRSEAFWPGRLQNPKNTLVEREPLWFDLNLEFIEDMNDYLVPTSPSLALDEVQAISGTLDSTLETNPILPSQNNEVIIACMAGREGPYSVNSPFTISDQVAYAGGINFGCGLAYKIQTTAAAISATWTQSGISMAVILAGFKAASGVFALVSHAGSTGDSFSALAGPINTTAAKLIVIALSERAFSAGVGTSTNLADSQGNIWTLAAAVQANFNERINLYCCFDPFVNAAHTFNADAISVESYPAICVAAFSRA